eukprot:CAMPEP_0206459048 /NCGR_PEP_ID=MMETSP0324_2-20121206/23942_1 /ASSEMBLY_ACC=CAM_ASM_000836 /TAXON_ID=2866 /ORGANISM="Crypthecodinium cohnii, Strain Seligo" /LENGTH=80 /DNA_ID=CAMNT_0053930521 /DNA_START=134 /DNA_END=373 /DNA_ORIENTATION=-
MIVRPLPITGTHQPRGRTTPCPCAYLKKGRVGCTGKWPRKSAGQEKKATWTAPELQLGAGGGSAGHSSRQGKVDKSTMIP